MTDGSVKTDSKDRIGERAAKGLLWRGIARGTDFALQTGIGIALARLLRPRDFGVFAMARIALGVAQILREMGMGQALIQRRAITRAHVTVVFWSSLIAGLVIGSMLGGASRFVAAFFREPIVAPVLKLMALGFVLNALGTVPSSLLQRELGFHKLLVVDVIASVAYGTVGIALAYARYGVWSLVWAMLGQKSARLPALYSARPYLPSLQRSLSGTRAWCLSPRPAGVNRSCVSKVRSWCDLFLFPRVVRRNAVQQSMAR